MPICGLYSNCHLKRRPIVGLTPATAFAILMIINVYDKTADFNQYCEII
jgi:hypothetical protein